MSTLEQPTPGPDEGSGARHDVFLSYSRADRDAVVELVHVLSRGGLRAWVDLEDIPPSAEWMTEITRAIESADGFLVAVSPELARSEVCEQELEIAMQAGKRIVPIQVRPTDPASVPGALSALNWIDATDGELAVAAHRAMAALRTDLDHVRSHTRLQMQAGEWERRDSPRTLLLRGGEITAAEAVIASAAEPRATPLQAGFVHASRAAATRRQRGLIGVVAFALVLALGLSTIALVQRDRAIASERAATSRALAAQGLLALDRDVSVAALLAVEAMRSDPTPEAEQLMRIATQRTIWIDRTLRPHDGVVSAVAYSNDGSMLATTGADGSIRVEVERTRSMALEGAGTGPIRDLTFTADDRLLVAGGDGGLSVWDPRSGALVRRIETQGDVWSVALDDDGGFIAAGAEGGSVQVWTIEGHEVAELAIESRSPVSALGFHPGQSELVAVSRDGELRTWGTEDFSLLDSTGVKAALVTSLEFAPGGGSLALGTLDRSSAADGVVLVMDAGSGEVTMRLEGHADAVSDVSFDPDGRLLASSGVDGTVRIWDLKAGDQLGQPLRASSGAVNALDFDAAGTTLASGGSDGSVIEWDAVHRSGGIGGGAINVVAFSPEGDELASAEPYRFSAATETVGFGAVVLRDPKTLRPKGTLPLREARPYGLAFDPQGGSLVTSDVSSGAVERWRISPEAALRWGAEAPLPEGDWLEPLALSPDGSVVVAAAGEGQVIYRWDATTGEQLASIESQEGVYPIAFSPDGGTVVAGGWHGTIRVWSSDDWSPTRDIDVGDREVYALAYSPQGDVLAAGGFDQTVVIVDVATGSTRRTIDAGEAVLSIAFTPDGGTMAIGTESGALALYRTDTWARIGEPLHAQRDWVNSVAFAPDARSLVAGSEDGSIVLIDRIAWSGTVNELETRLCRVAGRDLTVEEWEMWLPDERYRETCEGAA